MKTITPDCTLPRIGVTIVAALLFLAGCSSLPTPESKDDTILVIPCRVVGQADDEQVDYFVVQVRGKGIKKEYRLTYRDRLLFVHGLPRGTYRLAATHHYHDGRREGPLETATSSFVKPGSITINRKEFLVEIDDGRLDFDWRNMTPARHNRVVDRVSDMENFALWKVLGERRDGDDSSVAGATAGPAASPEKSEDKPAGANAGTLAVPVLIAGGDTIPFGYRLSVRLNAFAMAPKTYLGNPSDKLVLFRRLGPGAYNLTARVFRNVDGHAGEAVATVSSGVEAGRSTVNSEALLLSVRDGTPHLEWIALGSADRANLESTLVAAGNETPWQGIPLDPATLDREGARSATSASDAGEFTGLGVPVSVAAGVEVPFGHRLILHVRGPGAEPRPYGTDPKSQVVVFAHLDPGRYQLRAELMGTQGWPIARATSTTSIDVKSGVFGINREGLSLWEDDGELKLGWAWIEDSQIERLQNDIVLPEHLADSGSVPLPSSVALLGSRTAEREAAPSGAAEPGTEANEGPGAGSEPEADAGGAAGAGPAVQPGSSQDADAGPAAAPAVAPDAGPEIRASAVTIALPDHEPAVSYRDGKRYWGELKHGLVPEGSGLLAYPDGTVYDGEFVGGVFEGTGTLAYPDGTTFQGRFSQGLPTDDGDLTVDPRRLAENDDRAKELLRELKTARDELSRAAASEASSADLEAIMARIRQTETSLRELVDVEALLSRIGIDSDISLSLEDGLDARFHLSSETETRTVADTFEETTRTDTDLVVEDREVAVQRTEETTTTSSDGEVVQVETSTTEAKADTDFVGVEHREELRERRYEPVTSLAFGTWNLDYTGSSVMGYSSHNILALLGYRSVSRSTPFPGAEGGSKPGFDFRLSAGAGLGIFGGEAMASLSGWGSIGYSKVTFEPLNQNDLTQKGKGFSIGLQLGGTIIPAQGIFEPIVAPLFTIDRYTYNPSTAMYRASFYRLFIWPVPFMLYLGIGGSF